MRSIGAMFLLVVLSVASGSYAFGEERSAQSSFTFGLPFTLGEDGRCPIYPEGLSLADSVPECHANVALISGEGVCNTRTLYRFIYRHPGGEEFQATLLEKRKECPEAALIAVIGVKASEVRLVPPKRERSTPLKDLDSKARRLLDPREGNSAERRKEVGMDLADALPEVLTVGHVMMLSYGLKGERGQGPAVIYLNDRLFPLEGWCTVGNIFFSVKDGLYLSYTRHCCVCGEVISYVYELSGDSPRIVYQNGKFSD